MKTHRELVVSASPPVLDSDDAPDRGGGSGAHSHPGAQAVRRAVDPRQWAEIRLFAESLVGVKARQIIGKAGLRWSDLQDIRQDLLLYLVGRLSEYDRRRGPVEAHATMLITTAVAMLLRRRRAQARGKPPVSLDGTSDQERMTAWHLSPTDRDRRLGVRPRATQDFAEIRMDLADAMASLPADLRALSCLLVQGETEASVARLSGRSRRQVHKEVEAIRAHLEGCGLHGSCCPI